MSKFIVSPRGESDFLLKEAHNFLGLDHIQAIKQYHVFELDEKGQVDKVLDLFDEVDLVEDLSAYDQPSSFRYRQILGQYDEVSEMTNRLVQKVLGEDLELYHSVIVELVGADQADTDRFKDYFINETEAELVDFSELSYDMGESQWADLVEVEGFNDLTEAQLIEFIQDYSMDLADIKVVQAYFQGEGVNPTKFQLNVIDTYWSDHCRHTTFLTELTNIQVAEGDYQAAIEATIEEYNQVREEVYAGRAAKKVTLMDMGTINAKYAKKLGLLNNVDESDEVNACCIKIKVDVDGEEEDYLLYFKNETHNHPTEIEPFGGAATCIGGGIRDPLSGRSYVHQAMRITGAEDPTKAYDETRPGKLPQRVISQRAAEGYSDYGNQIGQTAGFVQEYYHPGFEAKRMELGALVAAAPVDHVVRFQPEPGDLVILLGGRTGRDGLGAAVGSSMVQTEKSMELQGAEVQKGNPAVERKIIRLFRQPEATRLIKKCNDFGAGGVAVAIGELADGLNIQLDKVPTKYPGMDPAEIALAESQERMAVVVAPEDVEEFIGYAEAEDIEASVVAEVIDSPYMIMNYEGEEVLRLKREFLDSNGGPKMAEAIIYGEDIKDHFRDDRPIKEQLSDIRYASQQALAQNFDFTIGKGTVLAPYGGKTAMTPQEGMVAKIPVLGQETETVSVMTHAFKPEIATTSPYHGGYLAVVASVAKAVALGIPYQEARLTFQEFFESMRTADNWGKPASALLGAFKAQKQLGLGAIGGKDSMSGTFEDLTVPPSLLSFAVASTQVDKVNSREFKATDSKVYLIAPELGEGDIFETEVLTEALEAVTALIEAGSVRAISTTDNKTVEQNLVEMALGNGIGFKMNADYLGNKYPVAFLVEVAGDVEVAGGVLVAETIQESVADLDQAYDLAELATVYTEPLSDVFTQVELEDQAEVKPALDAVEAFDSDVKVLIPVINGVNGEYDLYNSFKEYTDQVDFFVIKEDLDYQASVKELGAKLADYDILAFPDGSIFGNRMSYGQGIELVLEDIKDDLTAFIQDKYILAVGASLAGFVRTGLMEFGEFKEGTQLAYTANPYDKFISDLVPVNVVKASDFAEEGSYTTALAAYTLTLEAQGADLEDQVLARYARFLPGRQGIDAMTDPSGHILGINSNTERLGDNLLINVETVEAPYIANLVKLAGK